MREKNLQKSRIDLLTEFDSAPPDTLFSQKHIAAVRECSEATLERDRWVGTGIPYQKINGRVRYRKQAVIDWLGRFAEQDSTSAVG